MKRVISAVSLILAGCGSTPSHGGDTGDGGTTDYAAAYVGAWSGTATIVAGSNTTTQQAKVPIQELSKNLIELHGFCSDTDPYAVGPQANTTSTGFSVIAGSCTYTSVACSVGQLTFQWSNGSGRLLNGQLSTTVSGTLACNGGSVDYGLTYSSSQKDAYGTLSAGGDAPGLGANLASERQ